jgi:quinol monooxygenase YgiN
MIILAGTVRIANGMRSAALLPLQAMIEATRAEPGCIAYALAFDALDDHLLRVFEIFEDEDALAAHRASAHMAAWRAAGHQLGIGDRNISQYDVSGYRKI